MSVGQQDCTLPYPDGLAGGCPSTLTWEKDLMSGIFFCCSADVSLAAAPVDTVKGRCHRVLSLPRDSPICMAQRHAALLQGELPGERTLKVWSLERKAQGSEEDKGTSENLLWGEKTRAFVLLLKSVAIENIFQVHVLRVNRSREVGVAVWGM